MAQLQEADKYVNIVSDQVPYSMVKRDIEKNVIPEAIATGKAIIAYSPLERGLLTGKMKPGHTFEEGDHRAGLYFFKDENLQRVNTFLDKIKPLADDKGASLSQLVLRWTIDQPGITIALAGARNAKQSVQNAKAINVTLSKEELDFITSEVNKLELVK